MYRTYNMEAEMIDIYKIWFEHLMGRGHMRDLGTDEE